jgi:GTP-binding protein HflX
LAKTKSERRRTEPRSHPTSTGPTRERAVLVGVHLTGGSPGARQEWADLEELERLAETAGAVVMARVEQRRARPDVRSLLGKGKVEQLKQLIESVTADLVVFDNTLAPAQGRNLEKQLGVRVIDRTELILDIFARHARTRQACLQVELAQYEYMLPRLTRMWEHLERQAGGIGTRGPGESQLETDRRIIRTRIAQLKRELAAVQRQMATQHKQRDRYYRVTLVGYTNAGKSSIMNCITEAGVYVRDQLFATLDATTRRVRLDDRHDFLLTDTVGFIRKLPHDLVESFRATLSEINESNLLFHIVDASAADLEGQILAVDAVLAEVCPQPQPTVLVFNKIDLVAEPQRLEELAQRYPDALFTSATAGTGIAALHEEVRSRLRGEQRELLVAVETSQSRTLAQLHALAEVLSVEYDHDQAHVRLRVDGPNYGRVVRLPGLQILEVARRRRRGRIPV